MLADSQGRGIRIEAEIQPEIEAWADETILYQDACQSDL